MIKSNNKYNNTLSNKLVFYSNKIKVKPFITYSNALLSKINALENNKYKSAIYRWINIITGESYVGRSKNLTDRLVKYYDINYLNREIKNGNSRIYRALLIYGYTNFSLEILEYCDEKSLAERERYYIYLLQPEYNIRCKSARV